MASDAESHGVLPARESVEGGLVHVTAPEGRNAITVADSIIDNEPWLVIIDQRLMARPGLECGWTTSQAAD